MRPRNPLSSIALVVALSVFALLGHAGVAVAQSFPPHDHTPAISIGGSAGLLTGDFSLQSLTSSDSLSAGGGRHLSGRAEIAVTSALRVRFEESVTNWSVTRTTYTRGPGGMSQSATFSDADVGARQTTVAVGRQRCPCGALRGCAYILGGVALHTFNYKGGTIRRPGILTVMGTDLPLSGRSMIQLEFQVQLIGIHTEDTFIRAYDIPTLGLSAGWIYRF